VEADISSRSAADNYASLEPEVDDRYDNVDNPFYLDDIISLDATLASISSVPDCQALVDEDVVVVQTNQKEDHPMENSCGEWETCVSDKISIDSSKVRALNNDITVDPTEAQFDASSDEIYDAQVDGEKSIWKTMHERAKDMRECGNGALCSTSDVGDRSEGVSTCSVNVSSTAGHQGAALIEGDDTTSAMPDLLDISCLTSLDEHTTL